MDGIYVLVTNGNQTLVVFEWQAAQYALEGWTVIGPINFFAGDTLIINGTTEFSAPIFDEHGEAIMSGVYGGPAPGNPGNTWSVVYLNVGDALPIAGPGETIVVISNFFFEDLSNGYGGALIEFESQGLNQLQDLPVTELLTDVQQQIANNSVGGLITGSNAGSSVGLGLISGTDTGASVGISLLSATEATSAGTSLAVIPRTGALATIPRTGALAVTGTSGMATVVGANGVTQYVQTTTIESVWAGEGQVVGPSTGLAFTIYVIWAQVIAYILETGPTDPQIGLTVGQTNALANQQISQEAMQTALLQWLNQNMGQNWATYAFSEMNTGASVQTIMNLIGLSTAQQNQVYQLAQQTLQNWNQSTTVGPPSPGAQQQVFAPQGSSQGGGGSGMSRV